MGNGVQRHKGPTVQDSVLLGDTGEMAAFARAACQAMAPSPALSVEVALYQRVRENIIGYGVGGPTLERV